MPHIHILPTLPFNVSAHLIYAKMAAVLLPLIFGTISANVNIIKKGK